MPPRLLPLLAAGLALGWPAAAPAQALDLSGLVQFDAAAYREDRFLLDGDPGDGAHHDAGIRRGSLVLGGRTGEWRWRAGYDLQSHDWLDVDAQFAAKPGVSFRIGQFRQPGGIDAQSSAVTMDFVAGAMASDAFAIGRRTGIGLEVERDAWGFDAAAFGANLNPGGARGHGIALHGYATASGGPARRWHAGASLVRTADGDARWRVRPGADFATAYLAGFGPTGPGAHSTLASAEAAYLAGALKLQAEYTQARGQPQSARGRGGYASAVMNLDGRAWNYRHGRPQLARDDGALWQLGLRYDHVALERDGIPPGRLRALTAGVNVYWRDFKAMFDIVALRGRRDGQRDAPAIAEARLQYAW
jgi:phosphate-selective porin OprO/OprP